MKALTGLMLATVLGCCGCKETNVPLEPTPAEDNEVGSWGLTAEQIEELQAKHGPLDTTPKDLTEEDVKHLAEAVASDGMRTFNANELEGVVIAPGETIRVNVPIPAEIAGKLVEIVDTEQEALPKTIGELRDSINEYAGDTPITWEKDRPGFYVEEGMGITGAGLTALGGLDTLTEAELAAFREDLENATDDPLPVAAATLENLTTPPADPPEAPELCPHCKGTGITPESQKAIINGTIEANGIIDTIDEGIEEAIDILQKGAETPEPAKKGGIKSKIQPLIAKMLEQPNGHIPNSLERVIAELMAIYVERGNVPTFVEESDNRKPYIVRIDPGAIVFSPQSDESNSSTSPLNLIEQLGKRDWWVTISPTAVQVTKGKVTHGQLWTNSNGLNYALRQVYKKAIPDGGGP